MRPLTISTDVRHVSPDDVLSAVTISNTTRALASRDATIAEKVNEIVGQLNNASQLIQLPIPYTSLGPRESILVCSFRVPTEYQAALFNATISSSPTASSVTVEVLHTTGSFGGDGTGQSASSLAATLTEYSAEGSWYDSGEIVVRLENTTDSRQSVRASVTVKLRAV